MNLKLKLRDVYGGDGVVRPYQVEAIKLSRSRTKTLTRTDVGVPVESEMSEEQTELKECTCHTFKRDEGGIPMLRLGGTHGKLWGALKECAELLKDSKGLFKSYAEVERLMRSLRVYPIYVRLEDAGGITVEELPQILAGRRSSMIQQYFDRIPECRAEIKIVFPDVNEKKIKEMLEVLPEISCLNKRRGTIEVIST